MEEARKHARLNEKMWDSRAETYDKLFHRFYFHFTQKRVVSLLNLHENQCFLDMGCGTGWGVRYAASLVKNKGTFYGIDISSKMIEKERGETRPYQMDRFAEYSGGGIS